MHKENPHFEGVRFMRHTRILTALLALLLSAAVSAQGFALYHFNLDDLGREPGVVKLSPNYLSLIEFDDPIQTAATGRSDLIDVNVDGNRIILRPARSVGKTDLIVQVAGKTALFRVEIAEENGSPRRYVVETPEPPTPIVRTERSAPAISNTGPVGVPTQTAAPRPAAPAPQVPATPSLEDELASRNIPGFDQAQPQAQQQPSNRVSGRTVPFSFATEVDVATAEEIILRYTLKNNGGNMIANDSTRLRILDTNGKPVEYTIVRMNPDGVVNRIRPGYSEYGTIRVANPPAANLRIEWPLVEIGPGVTYTIDEIIVELGAR